MTTSPINTTYLDEFLELARSGAPEAAPYLVSLCGARLSNYVNMLAPDLSTADRDVVCERAIERAVRDIDNYDRTRSSFDTWVRGYARYICREYRRQNPVSAVAPADLPETYNFADEPIEPESAHQANVRLVRHALTELSDADRLVIRLRDYEQLPYESIAKILKVQPAACRQRHARALSRLRNSIESVHHGGSAAPADHAAAESTALSYTSPTEGRTDV